MPNGRGPWPDAAAFGEGGMSIGAATATELAERFGTPLVVVDQEHLRERARAFRHAFPDVLWAVKAFPLRALIRLAIDEGLGLLAATSGELDTCLRAGAPPDRIALHGNNKLDEELQQAVGARVRFVILDHESEVDRLADAAAAAGTRQPVLLRIAPAVAVEAHEYVTTGAPDTKFGTPLAGGLAMRALARALRRPELDVRGIHLHLGSQLLHLMPYAAGIEVALDFLAAAGSELGFAAEVLDVGGGMGTVYTEEEPPTPAQLAESVRGLLAEGCARRGLAPPSLVVEPGRAVTSGAAVTIYRVGSIKETPGVRTYVAVDGGMSDNIRPALYGSHYTLRVASRAPSSPGRTVSIVGRHCESGDVLARDVQLPEDLARGDLLAFASTGAYEYAMASTYNKVGRPAVVLVGEGGPRLIARRETLDDLARLDVE